MEAKTTIRVGTALALAAAVGIVGCSSDSPSGPGPKGSLELRVSYEGSLGTVDAEHVILARLYEGLDSDARGVPDEFMTATTSPDTLSFVDLAAGTYTLCVVYDVGGDGLQQACPYEVYRDKALGVTPNAVVISGGATTPLEVAFDDTNLMYPEPRGSLELTIAYEGSLGTVDAEHPILARLYEGLNSDAQGPPYALQSASQSPDTLRFEDLAPGTYTLSAIFDVGGDGLQQACPYEVYRDKAFGIVPNPVVISSGAATQLSMTFGDQRLAGTEVPDFALRDINPDSPTLGDTLALSSWLGDRLLVYFGLAT